MWSLQLNRSIDRFTIMVFICKRVCIEGEALSTKTGRNVQLHALNVVKQPQRRVRAYSLTRCIFSFLGCAINICANSNAC